MADDLRGRILDGLRNVSRVPVRQRWSNQEKSGLVLTAVEMWDAEDFDPWETLDWETVRVFFYRQHKQDGTVVEAYWLTNFPSSTVGPRSLFRMAKSRWEIENQGFNDAKIRHGLEHICHHHANSLLLGWLLTMLA